MIRSRRNERTRRRTKIGRRSDNFKSRTKGFVRKKKKKKGRGSPGESILYRNGRSTGTKTPLFRSAQNTGLYQIY